MGRSVPILPPESIPYYYPALSASSRFIHRTVTTSSAAADFVLVASGTATLEAAIMQKPNVVIYKMGLLNYLLYRPLVRVPFIGMENIVAGKLIAPEFIQFKAGAKLIADKALEILQDKEKLAKMQEDFSALKERLGPPQGAPLRAAQSILAFINPSLNLPWPHFLTLLETPPLYTFRQIEIDFLMSH